MYLPNFDVRLTVPYGLAILRIVLGISFLVHGWQKWQNMAGTGEFFGNLGIPAAPVVAYVVGTVELLGGLFLIAGFLTQISSILLFLVAFGAIVYARLSGPFIEGGGIAWEREAVFAAAALCLFLSGPGAWSVDDVMAGSRTRAARAI